MKERVRDAILRFYRELIDANCILEQMSLLSNDF
jgi:hypothetical protein